MLSSGFLIFSIPFSITMSPKQPSPDRHTKKGKKKASAPVENLKPASPSSQMKPIEVVVDEEAVDAGRILESMSNFGRMHVSKDAGKSQLAQPSSSTRHAAQYPLPSGEARPTPKADERVFTRVPRYIIKTVFKTVIESSYEGIAVPVDQADSGIYGASIAAGIYHGAHHHMLFYGNRASLSVEEMEEEEIHVRVEPRPTAPELIRGPSPSKTTVPPNSKLNIVPPSGSQHPVNPPVEPTNVFDLTGTPSRGTPVQPTEVPISKQFEFIHYSGPPPSNRPPTPGPSTHRRSRSVSGLASKSGKRQRSPET